MDLTRKTLDPDAKTKTPPLPNGALKKHHQPGPSPAAAPPLYRECLKNHAASLGGHALDGCGEFMPSASSNPADPTSLTCAACGCHRNFHRRLAHPHEGEEEMDGQDEGNEDHDDNRHSSSPPPSAPHMLLALSAGLSAGPTQGNSNPVGSTQVVGAGVLPRKRFRTKFNPEQKERMHELSEKLGWRMQKRDEGLVEEYCKGIGVGKGVFKVWMHNNKHNFLGLRRGEGGGGARSGGGGCVVEGNGSGGDGGDGSNSHVVNGSTSSS